MGQEIEKGHFRDRDFVEFGRVLRQESELLADYFRTARFSARTDVGGFEMEAWLIDDNCSPAPINEAYLALMDSPLVVPELAMFNVELNTSPRRLHGNALRRMEDDLGETRRMCREGARKLNADMVMIGILPTVRDQDLTLANMSRMKRYKALNEQVLRLRKGRPMNLDIHGREHLQTTHTDVMLESAATSFQIHLQVPLEQAARFYNAALAMSAATVALAANSPFLFGKDLWDETRIPLFEQAVEVGGLEGAAFGPMRRVTFGTGYVRESLMECFTENLEHYPVLLPMRLAEEPSHFSHLRLHNGTIWRWNRPLIGFDDDGTPHLRIEHRVAPAGPSVIDAIANAAFFFGLVYVLAHDADPPERSIDFSHARDNFYAAARQGLRAQFTWGDRNIAAHSLLLNVLIPMARLGLERLEISKADCDRYIEVIEARVRTGQNGSAWQRAHVQRHGRDMRGLTAAYVEHQASGAPVHEWPV